MPKTIDFDVLAASFPVDENARRITEAPGMHFSAGRKSLPKIQRRDYRACVYPIATWKHPKPWTLAQLVKQQTGKKYGLWTVIGYAEWQGNEGSSAKWVVRCSCGRYEIRRMRSLRRAADTQDCCWECKTLRSLRKSYDNLKLANSREGG